MLDYLFPLITVKVVGKTTSVAWAGMSDYCVENELNQRQVMVRSNAWAQVGDQLKLRNFWICWE